MKASLGAFQLTVAMLLSGSIGVVVTMSQQSPENVVFFRCGIAFCYLLPYCMLRGLIQPKFFSKHFILPVCASGVFIVSNWVLLFKAYPLVTIGLATTVYHVNPFWVLLGGCALLRQPIRGSDLGWTAVVFVCLTMAVTLPGGIHPSRFDDLVGIALTLTASALYACTVLLSKLTLDVPLVFVVLMQTFLGILLMLPFVSFSAVPDTTEQWASVGVLGVVHTFILYCLVFSAYQKLSVNSIAVFFYLSSFRHRIGLFGLWLCSASDSMARRDSNSSCDRRRQSRVETHHAMACRCFERLTPLVADVNFEAKSAQTLSQSGVGSALTVDLCSLLRGRRDLPL